MDARGLNTPEGIGLSSAIANIGVPVGAFIFQALSRQPVMRLLTASFALFAAGFVIIAAFPDPQTTVAGSFVACMGGGMALPLLLTLTMARLPYEQRGRGSGSFAGAFYIGQFLSPVIIAIVSTAAGGLVPAIGAMSWAFGGAAVIALLVSLTSAGASVTLGAAEAQQGAGH